MKSPAPSSLSSLSSSSSSSSPQGLPASSVSPAKANRRDGITLETIVTELSTTMGWAAMAAAVPVRCFSHDPSVSSSLKFLRRMPWARQKVEALYWQQLRQP